MNGTTITRKYNAPDWWVIVNATETGKSALADLVQVTNEFIDELSAVERNSLTVLV